MVESLGNFYIYEYVCNSVCTMYEYVCMYKLCIPYCIYWVYSQ